MGSTLSFTTQPMDALKNTTLAPVRVTVVDANGMPVTTTNVPITLALGTNPSSATLAGTLTVNATAGVATFSDLSIDLPGNGDTLVATAPGATDGTSAPFAIKSTGWVATNAGLTGGVINDLILDPKHPATLYAATADNGVWKTIDGGNNWARAATGLPRRHSVDALAIDPVTTTTLWAACGDAGVYKSADGGGSWVQSTAMILMQGQNAAIAVDPSHPMVVYAAMARAVARTVDGGATWTMLASGATYGAGPRSIAIHPTTGDVWLAQFGDGLWKMPYNGTSFTLADGTTSVIPGPHPYMKCVAFNPTDPNKMYASGDITRRCSCRPTAAPTGRERRRRRRTHRCGWPATSAPAAWCGCTARFPKRASSRRRSRPTNGTIRRPASPARPRLQSIRRRRTWFRRRRRRA